MEIHSPHSTDPPYSPPTATDPASALPSDRAEALPGADPAIPERGASSLVTSPDGSVEANRLGQMAPVDGSTLASRLGSPAPSSGSTAAPWLSSAAPLLGSAQATRLGSPAQKNSSEPGNLLGLEIPVGSFPQKSSVPTEIESPTTLVSLAASDSAKSKFSPSIGAWAKPLPLSPERHAPSNTEQDIFRSDWPSLSASLRGQVPRKNKQPTKISTDKPEVSIKQSTPAPLSSDDDPERFPWSAKMDPSLRNLYRATTPVYLEDGTPQVTIPSSVLLEGLENQKEYVLGQFYRCKTPSGGLVNAVVNRIWGKKCRIYSRLAGNSTYLFHIPDESTRSWVLRCGLWHVDDCMMFVAPWTPAASLVIPEISTVPVWVTLKNIPYQLYSIPGVSHIASGLGAPMLTNKPRLDPLFMGEAKIMVEVELNKPFPHRVAAKDDFGTVNMVDVEYAWIPRKCGNCGQLGHKTSRCLDLDTTNQVSVATTKELVSSAGLTMPITVSPIMVNSELTSPLLQSPTTAHVDNNSIVSTPQPNATIMPTTVLSPTIVEVDSPTTTSNSAINIASATALLSTLDRCSTDPQPTNSPMPVAVTIGSAPSPTEHANQRDSPTASEIIYSSSEDTFDDNKRLEEALQRKSTRETKPTLKARELQRSATRGRRGKGRRGRVHR